MVESRNVSVHMHLHYAKQEFFKNKHLLAKKGVCFVDFFQGAREESPADLERANADAQVINLNTLCVLFQFTVFD